MATVAENLQTAKVNLSAKLAEISANPLPNYSVDGISFSWPQYYDMLTSQIEKINKLQSQEVIGEFIEIRTEGVS